MLKCLSLQNIVLIPSLSISFQPGLSMITGETGAGKSMLMDALSWVFGAKVSPKEVLRTGTERAQIELLIDFKQSPHQQAIRQFLEEQGLGLLMDETEILLSREFTAGGSRSRLNGIAVSRDILLTLQGWLVGIQGQHEITNLFQKAAQRELLDAWGGGPLQTLKRQVAQDYDHWLQIKNKQQALLQGQQDRAQRLDFLQFQSQELEAAALTESEEDSRLQAELSVLSHAEKLKELSGAALDYFNEDGFTETPTILTQLRQVQKSVSAMARLAQRVEPLLERLNGLLEESKDWASHLENYHDSVDYDPEQIKSWVERLDLLEKLKRKYGPTLSDVLATQVRVESELVELLAMDQDTDLLSVALNQAEEVLQQSSQLLTEKRQQLASSLQKALIQQLHSLALPHVAFEVAFHSINYSTQGTEEVEFLFSANPGEPLRSLSKVASGGELSRFLLALKVLTADSEGIQTLIFDEIDTGLSGATAKAVAEKLVQLSHRHQVLVITHQPIVAAMADQHLHVEKTTSLEGVTVNVSWLTQKERRLSVLSRLASGIDTDDEAVEKFAQRLLSEAEQWKLKTISN